MHRPTARGSGADRARPARGGGTERRRPRRASTGTPRPSAASCDGEQDVVATGRLDHARVLALQLGRGLLDEGLAYFRGRLVEPRGAVPPAGAQSDELLAGFPRHVLVDHFNPPRPQTPPQPRSPDPR